MIRMKWQSIHSFMVHERLLGVPLLSLTIVLPCHFVPSKNKAFLCNCVHLFFRWQWEQQDIRDGSQSMLSNHELVTSQAHLCNSLLCAIGLHKDESVRLNLEVERDWGLEERQEVQTEIIYRFTVGVWKINGSGMASNNRLNNGESPVSLKGIRVHVGGRKNMQFLSFSDWVITFNIRVSRSIHFHTN